MAEIFIYVAAFLFQTRPALQTSFPVTMAIASKRSGFATSRTTVAMAVMRGNALKISATLKTISHAETDIASPKGGAAMATSIVQMLRTKL